MEANEIIMNDEAMEVTGELARTNSGTGLKVVGGILALAGLAFGGYKLFKRHKTKKKMYTIPQNDSNECSEDECSDEE